MGGAVSSGRDNNELIDNLMGGNYIRTRVVERVFRSLDRADYMTPESRDQAYKDLAWRNGPLHMSAPCIYSEVLEELELKPGLSFLNIGSGTGYFSTLVGLIIGPSGINHGIEVHPYTLDYAMTKLRQFIENSPTLDEFDFCEPRYYGGNGLSIPPLTAPYDRLYCGAGCPEEYQNYFKQLIKVGGILVMPLNDNLVQIKRTAVDQWVCRSLLNVSFATLRVPSKDDRKEFSLPFVLDEQCPARLQVLARGVVRRCMRATMLARHPGLRPPPPRRPPPQGSCPRRICIPIEDDSDVEGLNALHDLDNLNGANEMNALLNLVINMGQNRVAGALRFDSLDSSSDSEDEDDDNDDGAGDGDSGGDDGGGGGEGEDVEGGRGEEAKGGGGEDTKGSRGEDAKGSGGEKAKGSGGEEAMGSGSEEAKESGAEETKGSGGKDAKGGGRKDARGGGDGSGSGGSGGDDGAGGGERPVRRLLRERSYARALRLERRPPPAQPRPQPASKRACASRGLLTFEFQDDHRSLARSAGSRSAGTRAAPQEAPEAPDAPGASDVPMKADCSARSEPLKVPAEVEIYLGKEIPGTSRDMDWEGEMNATKEESSSEEENTETSKQERKRKKLDSGIGEGTTTSSSSSPGKSDCQHDHDAMTLSDLENDASGAGECCEKRGPVKRCARAQSGSASSESGSGSASGGGGRRRKRRAPDAPRRRPGPDARRVRLSILMKRGVKELPLPYALKKYVNLGRCFEF